MIAVVLVLGVAAVCLHKPTLWDVAHPKQHSPHFLLLTAHEIDSHVCMGWNGSYAAHAAPPVSPSCRLCAGLCCPALTSLPQVPRRCNATHGVVPEPRIRGRFVDGTFSHPVSSLYAFRVFCGGTMHVVMYLLVLASAAVVAHSSGRLLAKPSEVPYCSNLHALQCRAFLGSLSSGLLHVLAHDSFLPNLCHHALCTSLTPFPPHATLARSLAGQRACAL